MFEPPQIMKIRIHFFLLGLVFVEPFMSFHTDLRCKLFLKCHLPFVESCPPNEIRYFNEVPVTLYRPTNNYVKYEAMHPDVPYKYFRHVDVNPDGLVAPYVKGCCSSPGVAFTPKNYIQERITVMPKGTPVPEYLQLINSCSCVYHLYPTERCTVAMFNKQINKFMRKLRTISKSEYFSM